MEQSLAINLSAKLINPKNYLTTNTGRFECRDSREVKGSGAMLGNLKVPRTLLS